MLSLLNDYEKPQCYLYSYVIYQIFIFVSLKVYSMCIELLLHNYDILTIQDFSILKIKVATFPLFC